MAIKCSATVWLIREARGGPFIFWDDLDDAMARAAALGFHAVEIFPPEPDALDPKELNKKLAGLGLAVSAVGSGGGWVKHQLSLTHPDAAHRKQAQDYIKRAQDFAAACNAPVIVGSMQGRWGGEVAKDLALTYLAEGLNALGAHAATLNQKVLYEPLNRYETNLVNTIEDGVKLLHQVGSPQVKLLADLFHMHIEEVNVAQAIIDGGSAIGHIHLADSNRRPAGLGHMNYQPIVEAIKKIGFSGYLGAEAFPYPDPGAAAAQTIKKFKELFGS